MTDTAVKQPKTAGELVREGKTPEELRIDDLNHAAYDQVMQLSGAALLKKLMEIQVLWLGKPAGLDNDELKLVGDALFIRKANKAEFVPFNPLESDADAFWVMSYFIILKEYEPYNSIGENFYARSAKNPIRFWEHDSDGLPGLPNTHPVHLCIVRAAVLGLHPEFTEHLNG